MSQRNYKLNFQKPLTSPWIIHLHPQGGTKHEIVNHYHTLQDPVTRNETKPNSQRASTPPSSNWTIPSSPFQSSPHPTPVSSPIRIEGCVETFLFRSKSKSRRGSEVWFHEISRGQVLTSLEPEASLYFNGGGPIFSRRSLETTRAWSVTRDTPNSWTGSGGPRRRRRNTKSAPVSPKPLPIPNWEARPDICSHGSVYIYIYLFVDLSCILSISLSFSLCIRLGNGERRNPRTVGSKAFDTSKQPSRLFVPSFQDEGSNFSNHWLLPVEDS